MKRTLFAVSILSAILSAHAQTRTPVRTESVASEFVYEALGATPSIRFGKPVTRSAGAVATQTAHAQARAAGPAARADLDIQRANETHSAPSGHGSTL